MRITRGEGFGSAANITYDDRGARPYKLSPDPRDLYGNHKYYTDEVIKIGAFCKHSIKCMIIKIGAFYNSYLQTLYRFFNARYKVLADRTSRNHGCAIIL